MRGVIEAFVQSLAAAGAAQQRNVSLNTVMAYRSDLEQFCDFLERRGQHTWSVSPLEVIEYKRDLEVRYAKATTRARKLAAVKAFYRYLVRTDQVASDPARHLDVPVPIKHAPETLSREQLSLLVSSARATDGAPPLEEAKSLRDYAMLSLLSSTGLLASELVALDLASRADAGALDLGAPSRQRTVTLDEATGAALDAYLAAGRPLLARGRSAEPALFVNHRGRRLTRQGFWLIVKQCAKRAGVDGISPRLLRHSCAAHKLTDGVQLKDVQELLGHAHASTTQAYVRARPVEVAP